MKSFVIFENENYSIHNKDNYDLLNHKIISGYTVESRANTPYAYFVSKDWDLIEKFIESKRLLG